MLTRLGTAPPFDPELKSVLDVVNASISPTLTPADIPALRTGGFTPTLDDLLANAPIAHEERVVAGTDGRPDVLVSVFRRRDHAAPGPGIVFAHVGGMVFGDRFVGVSLVLPYVVEHDAVVVSVEYRLAPEHPAPAALEDSYAALVWTADHADELGIDPARLVTAGASAGGGLAAGVTLLARDRGGPALAGQLLLYPMLDEADGSVSSRQVDGIGIWDRTSNETGWDAVLGARRHTDSVTIYESPSLATDLAGLPATYLEVGSVEVFRDETVDYALRLWRDGVDAELHVWPGAFHLFELFAPDATVSARSREARAAWVRRTLES